MSNYSTDPQRVDARSQTQKDPVGAPPNNSVVTGVNDEYMKNPPNNLDLADPSEQDRASDLIGARNTEPIADAPSKEEQKRVQELADKLNK
ncbi:hypothetical protein JCM5296_003319 [Sporobolomyces johnsonii]